DVVESRVEALQQSGLKPVLVDVHSQSLGHIWKLAAERFPEKNKYCLLDIGSLVEFIHHVLPSKGELFHKEFACGTRISMGTS
ncbi:pilus assembly protein PilM, partial [Vibrio parahaemolyticus]|nr:pilus assembly protein PilM [Vibrio parahaemolyticus]